MAEARASPTWQSADRPQVPPPDAAGWMRIIVRGVAILAVLALGLALTLALRLPERVSGAARPVTGWITVAVCRAVLALLGLRVRRIGDAAQGAGATVANHTGWLDIFVLNAGQPLTFVSKAEVRGWAGIGWLARATGTVFIRRARSEARAHVGEVADRLAAGHRLVLFAEGTSSDGARVLPFKPTLFEALVARSATAPDLAVQPVSLRYTAPPGREPRFYGWWGDMAFGPHALAVLAQAPQGTATLRYHPPVTVAQAGGRKALAADLERTVRAGFAALA